MKKDLKCAIVEYEDYHDQVIPTFVYALNKLDVEVDIFTTRRNRDKGVFFYDDHNLSYTWKSIEFYKKLFIERTLRYRGYDIVLFNTINEGVNEVSARRSCHICSKENKKIGVLHDGRFIQEQLHIQKFHDKSTTTVVVLSQHIARYVRSLGWNCTWILPVYFGSVQKKKNEKITFCVQGVVAPQRKDYTPLIEGIKYLKKNGHKDFQVLFVGRNSNKFGEAFKSTIASEGINDVCIFTEGDVPYNEFLQLIASSDFLIMLVDRDPDTKELLYPYKLTSSLFYAVGLGVIPIVEENMAQMYGINDCGVTYKSDDMTKALEEALVLSDHEKERYHAILKKKRKDLLDHAVEVMRSIIEGN
jgi:hypothetical protein